MEKSNSVNFSRTLLLSYTVEWRRAKCKTKMMVFNCDGQDWLVAREKAVECAVECKDAQKKYNGIKLMLAYQGTKSHGSRKAQIRKHSLLTGKRMHSERILTALAKEASIARAAGKTFPVMNTDNQFASINQKFVTLYYFTA